MLSTTIPRAKSKARRASDSPAAHALARAGLAARGIIYILIGWVAVLVGILVIDAGVTHSPPKSGGINKALLMLRDEPFGPVLLGLAALGLMMFGVHGLCEARWRRV
jgi:hypothetical protein